MSNEPKDIFMLCESCQDEKELAELDRNKWKGNIKYDGERVMCIKIGKDIVLFNRRGNIITYKFSEVMKAFSLLEDDFMIDGEVINIDNTIGGNFNLLSRRALTKDKTKIAQLEKEIPVKFMAFDILCLNGKNLKSESLSNRLSFLAEALKGNVDEHLEIVCYDEIDTLLNQAIANNGEGIVIKNMNSVYESKRSKNCLKHKLFKETTITITGFEVNNAGIRATDNNENCVQISGNQSNEVKQLLQTNGEVKINVQYLEKTKLNKLRFISYRGLAK